ncbi:hypothetical protein [Deinococcus arenicola]|uniref:Uncharacterized protein n=1 Tax=Deinococcus arenicola TaxID=2994950 RepID=A0ABU4DUS1_9DEIO|nr:hypothetical protein [Deinococcus sp. ZS9-10]MDV6375439.1 hypothetical protein [Deinococcus sp. ZS9-10]
MDESQDMQTLLELTNNWHGGEVGRTELVSALRGVSDDSGELIRTLITRLGQGAPRAGDGEEHPENTDAWRQELMACRARTWPYPHSAGLLVGPHVLILTDGEQGVLLRTGQLRVLTPSVSASLLLLCQTIVMAQHSLDGKVVGQARTQRIESASTSLSEIDPIK